MLLELNEEKKSRRLDVFNWNDFFETATFTLAEIDVLVGNSLSGLAGGLGLRTGDLLGGPVTGGEDCGGGLLLEEDEGGLEKNDKNCLGNDFSRAKNCRFWTTVCCCSWAGLAVSSGAEETYGGK